ncbi:cytochrome c oxidase assembly protein [Microbacterium sp.]|uniref:cytochrome c oxidase assembly protein n=1 Tax=Microbacterium sp. TaxID=51671 RepID=UPI003565D57E
MHDHAHPSLSFGQGILLLPFAAAALIYLAAAIAESVGGRPWPWWRTGCWIAGLGLSALALSPLTLAAADRPFTGHAVGHLLIGMVAPVLLVLAAPVTLALRSFALQPARRLSRALRSVPVRVVTHPVVAALLSVGSLWMLYASPIYAATADPLVHLLVMLHFLVAGCLFTASVAPVDPAPHRASLRVRVVVLILALAAHGILAKTLYASGFSPDSAGAGGLSALVQVPGVAVADLQTGAQVMYYGGDAVDLMLLALVLLSWYRSRGRRSAWPPAGRTSGRAEKATVAAAPRKETP